MRLTAPRRVRSAPTMASSLRSMSREGFQAPRASWSCCRSWMLRLVFVLKAWRRGCRPVGPGVEAVPCGPHFTSCLIPRLVGEIPSGLLIRFRPWKRAGRLHSIEKARADLMPSQAFEGSSSTAPCAAIDEEESGRELLCRPFSERVAPPLRHMVPYRSALRKGSGTVVSGFLAVLRRPSRRLGCSP